MKIFIEKRTLKADGTRTLRLIYDHGYTTKSNGSRQRKREHEVLDLFIYDKPKTPAQRKHNKEHLLLAETIKSKRLVEWQSQKHGFEDRTKRSASFIDYFQRQIDIKEQTTSTSNHSIWLSARKHLLFYCGKHDLSFDELDKDWLDGFKYYLTNEAKTKSDTALSRNTQSSYFNKVRAAINEAHREGIIRDNPLSQVTSIKAKTTKRVYLTLDEVNALAHTECRYPVLKRAFLFSCTTGMRWCDIHRLTWSEVETFNNHKRIIFDQAKLSQGDAKSLQYLDIPKSAESLLGSPKASHERVFKGLKYSSYINVELLRWALAAGISKHVTFHAGRHTFAVIQLSRGIDIYAVSKLLGHSELKTTEIYADIIEQRRMEAMLTFPDIFASSGKDSAA
ncbi:MULTISPECIES: site-specific integrase [Vibrio harveyi group]|uniref:site-specific integrase n=1 Tax=Vibrio harveyi group TaxID=717610 RepID=UPI00193B5C16|nr:MULTISPECIES: site-specific integrase [Vibrio harveyi group]ELU9054455.1 site-specific integrase [Vibrio parahaemolyticus]EII5416299.1 site-specific integrase [Vibrio alginolyticus]ELA8363542.1 site-specific integrase [Vibrio alginolyticus]ELE6600405.1 site-specific integrase [Vibrio alginolyticus]MCR9966621.1 site-specific integrase [Vibrio antiquarius]